uniref:F-ATPase protein 6 n=1 Tax=Bursaphelenchus mucronatus TaxID=6325 RepID=M4GHS0_BURMU|nr:ATP synthase F0 subunit 6 [Bursaphelenchus mucronatus]ACZ57367.1 ATP synthase F0 subunit 6 [Bursaphelenchus mucronatus]
MNNVTFLDIFLFVFILQFIYFFNINLLFCFIKKFLFSLNDVFSYSKNLFLSSIISCFIFLVLLTCCFGGYFSYSFCPCGMLEFTLSLALVSWLSTFLSFLSSEKISIYFSKSGDTYLKTLSMLVVEIVSEFSRPIALTVRLTVNIMVGHMISMSLFLLPENLGYYNFFFIIFAILMECFVFFIQSYIFSRLIFLYLNE